MHPIRIKLPGKAPKLIKKETQPDQRQFTVVPIRAATDKKLTLSELRVLMVLCSYANRGGITWVGLQRVADHLGVKINRASVITRSLIGKGYVKVLYKGWAGERAYTRQIIFNEMLTLDEIIAISQEKPPYMVEEDLRQAHKLNHKENLSMRKKRLATAKTISDNNDNNLHPEQEQDKVMESGLTFAEEEMLRRAVGPDLLSEAIRRCPAGSGLGAVQAELQRMLS